MGQPGRRAACAVEKTWYISGMSPTAQTRRTPPRNTPAARRPQLFRSVPDRDYLRLFDKGRPRGRRVVAILGYSKKEVAGAAGVPASSVRYDAKMPSDLR